MTTYFIGDLHGYADRYEQLLLSAGLVDESLNWAGKDATLWLMGDFFDRGESGIRCLDLTMRLQQEAALAGGNVQSLLGNHELMILCAYLFEQEGHRSNLYQQWRKWGGIAADFEAFEERHAIWISNLPAMALVDDMLLMHADAMLYVGHGYSIEAVNQSFRDLIASRDLSAWSDCLSSFSEHMTFCGLEMTGKQRAEQLLKLYGGEVIVHGHTPIPEARRVPAEEVTGPWEYAGGRCLNIDGGLYLGSPGFVYEVN